MRTTRIRVRTGTAPDGYRERRVASLFAGVLGLQGVDAEEDFFVLGGDDDTAERLLDAVAWDAGVRLPPGTARVAPTVRALATRVAETPPTRRARTVTYGPDLPGNPLFCMIGAFQAGAIAQWFTAAAGRPFVAVQPKGAEGRAWPDRTIRARAKRALADVRSVQPHGPYLISGYSYAAYVALEVARNLRALGERVDVAVMIDIWAPVFGRFEVAKLRHQTRWRGVCMWNPTRGPFCDVRRRAILARDTALAHCDAFAWWLRGLTAGIVPRGSTAQGMLFFHLAEASVARYRPRPVDFDLVVVRGDEFGGWDWRERRREPDLSWSRITSGGVEVIRVRGDHVSILEGENAAELAQRLAELVEPFA